jgi:hypothetical protein
MPSFKPPQYTKSTNPKNGKQEVCYTFNVEFDSDTSDYLSFIAEKEEDISVTALQKCISDNSAWWTTFLEHFLKSSTKYFSKPYTVEQITKITRHSLESSRPSTSYPIHVFIVPQSIKISGGTFTVSWSYTTEMMINFPDIEDNTQLNEHSQLPAFDKNESKRKSELEELNIDELPVKDTEGSTTLELDNPVKLYEKQRVKEARLKAKLAIYKAQHTISKYYDKYGEDISDSDTDLESSDEEDDDNSSDNEN